MDIGRLTSSSALCISMYNDWLNKRSHWFFMTTKTFQWAGEFANIESANKENWLYSLSTQTGGLKSSIRWVEVINNVRNHYAQLSNDADLCRFAFSLYFSLVTPVWSMDQHHWYHLKAYSKCRLSGPTPDFLYQNIHYSNLYACYSLNSITCGMLWINFWLVKWW